MRSLLCYQLFIHAQQLPLNALDLILRGLALLPIQFRYRRSAQPSLGSVHNGRHDLQIA